MVTGMGGCVGGVGGEGKESSYAVLCELVQPLWKLAWRVLKKPKMATPIWPRDTTPGIDLTASKSACLRETCTAMFVYSTHNSQKTGRDRILVADEWMKEMWYVHTMELYTAAERSKIIAFAGKRMQQATLRQTSAARFLSYA